MVDTSKPDDKPEPDPESEQNETPTPPRSSTLTDLIEKYKKRDKRYEDKHWP
jgi:hypothetical protein